jgi:hypothetical protein
MQPCGRRIPQHGSRSFSSATTAQPGKFFACLSNLVTECVQFHDLGAPVALFDFVFCNNFTVLQQFGGHALRINDLY